MSCWPVTRYHGRTPEVSDGFQAFVTPAHRAHQGVDIMLRRAPWEPPALPRGSSSYFAPVGWFVVAVAGGRIARVKYDPARGLNVTIVHFAGEDSPAVTFYQHMEGSPNVAAGDDVAAGDVLGLVGQPPSHDSPAHVHFGAYADDTGANSLDPAPWLQRWAAAGAYADQWSQESSHPAPAGAAVCGIIGLGLLLLSRR